MAKVATHLRFLFFLLMVSIPYYLFPISSDFCFRCRYCSARRRIHRQSSQRSFRYVACIIKINLDNAEEIFKPKSVDLWNLSRAGNVITLDNPFSGANASIVINTVDGRTIKFKRIGIITIKN